MFDFGVYLGRMKKDMTQLTEHIKTYGYKDDKTLLQVFSLFNHFSQCKTTMQGIALAQDRGVMIERLFDLPVKTIDNAYIRISSKKKKNDFSGIEDLRLDVENDVLFSMTTICRELMVNESTFNIWQNNWKNRKTLDTTMDLYFPPPVIYVYRLPRWSFRQIEWWLASDCGKAFQEGKENGRY